MVDKESLFISSSLSLVLFNIIYYAMNAEANPLQWGNLWSGILTAVVTATILAGVRIMGSGLSDTSIKVLFSSAILMILMFDFTIPGVNLTVGLGLLSNVLEVFSMTEMLGIGYLVVATLGIITFISAILIIIGA